MNNQTQTNHWQTLDLQIEGSVASLWLNRPEVHNAFNQDVIAELIDCLSYVDSHTDVRVLILTGKGKSFSAGADLNWMKAAGEASFEDNVADAANLARMLQALANLSKPTIARVHGAALGGGMGLASACDICVASEHAKFATSEVRLGLAPSTISPYVIRAIGERQAKRYFVTAERIDARTAHALGLAHEVCAEDELDNTINAIVHAILQGAPNAQHASKTLIDEVAKAPMDDKLLDYTAKHIATIRTQSEAKSGLQAFLDKQSPPWVTV